MFVLVLLFAVTVLDQVTKFLVMRHFQLGGSRVVIPGFFNLGYVRNTGAAWGMLRDFSGALALLSFIVLVVILIFRRRIFSQDLGHRISMALMMAGIAGNLLDRLRYGYVVDFLEFYWKDYRFPAFNVADSAICIGVALYSMHAAYSHWVTDRDARRETAAAVLSPAGEDK